MKSEALALRARFRDQVEQLFGDNVLFYIVCRTPKDHEWAIPALLNLLINFPMADVELVVESETYFRFDNAAVLELLELKGFSNSVTLTRFTATSPNHMLPPRAFLVDRPTAKHRTLYVHQWAPTTLAFDRRHVSKTEEAYRAAFDEAEHHGVL